MAAAVIAGAVVLRFTATSGLWLDEALSVNIASLPLTELVGALRQDGHPPLYYGLLNLWMRLFGDGDLAVRSLSGVFAVLTLPLVGVLAHRRRGLVAGLAAMVVMAVMPFATRYGTEARMYALVMLLVAVGWLLVDRLLDDAAGPWSAVGLGVVAALLLYTHYWSFWILGVTGLALLLTAWRAQDHRRRIGARRGALGLIGGGLAFVPWLPVLFDQLAHTGTPWGAPQRPTASMVAVLFDLAGGPLSPETAAGVLVLTLIVILGIAGVPDPPSRVILDLRTVPGMRTELGVVVAALTIGMVVTWIDGSTFASRYAAFAVPAVAVAAGIGISTAPSRTWRMAIGGLTVVTLGAASVLTVFDQRTQGPAAAAAVSAQAEPGDVVIVCPDQLGPAFARELDADVRVMTYPDLSGPERVNWRDYAERNTAADPRAIAETIVDGFEGTSVFVVWMGGYATYGSQCEQLRLELGQQGRYEPVLEAGLGRYFEPMWVDRFVIN